MPRPESKDPLAYVVLDEELSQVGSGRDERALTIGEKLVQARIDWSEIYPDRKVSIVRVPDTGVVP